MRFSRYAAAILAIATLPAPFAPAQTPGEIYKDTGVRGGLVVHLNCGDGGLTAKLRVNKSYLVHGLSADPKTVARVREAILGRGIYGPVSIGLYDGRRLPYAGNMVNLLIADELGDVAMEEVMRVLVPDGVALINGRKTVKPRPDEIDEWTHYLHDATNDGTAKDTVVGPIRRMKWHCAPLWSRSHEYTSSMAAMVTANGRVFYIFDEGLTGVTPPNLPEIWTLTARDAFNGALLWKRLMNNWRGGLWKGTSLRGRPPWVPRLLVAAKDLVFTPLGLNAPVSVIDAATGEVKKTLDETLGADEIRCLDDVLLARMRRGGVLAFEASTGKKLWETKDRAAPISLAAAGGKAFYVVGREVVCRDLKTGKEIWKTGAPGAAGKTPKKKGRKKRRGSGGSLLIVHGDYVLFTGAKGLTAVSAETGKTIWSARGGMGKEVFVARGRIWQGHGRSISGRDIKTGEVRTHLSTDDVYTPGHHPRCYQGKATVRYLITPWRGIEFIGIAGDKNTQHDWARGPCRYGIMPANGLLYVPPHPCFCYPGVKLTGFNALAAGETNLKSKRPGARLFKGPAYGKTGDAPAKGDWPTYRHDARRTGSAACEVAPEAVEKWKVKLRPPLAPPVFANGLVYVAAKDEHTLYAIKASDGSEAWHFTAGGRIDSPPTIYKGLVLMGCTDGRVYCLRAADGELAWRFRAAPADRLIGGEGQLESAWRVHGSILIHEDTAYCTAGRSTYLDGGIHLFGLEPATGEIKYDKTFDTWNRERVDAVDKPFVAGYHIEGSHSDILVSEGGLIFLGQYQLDGKLEEKESPYVIPKKGDEKVVTMDLSGRDFVDSDVNKTQGLEVHQRKWLERAAKKLVAELRGKHGAFNIGHRRMGRHVLATGGFLDDTWFNRTYWMYSESWPGFYLAHRAAKTGQLLVVGPEKTYCVQAYPRRNMQSPLFTPGEKGYQLFADSNDNEPVLSDETRETTKGWGFTRSKPPVWHEWVPIRMRAMVLAGKVLFVAGPPDLVDEKDPMASFEGRKGAVIRAVSSEDGKKISEQKLQYAPVFDGLIAASSHLFMCTIDGRVVCLGKK